jgi:hypothetical protein
VPGDGSGDAVHRIYVEDWAAAYGSPYVVRSDDVATAEVRLVEDGLRLERHPSRQAQQERIAFVDGVRRGDACLYQEDAACGALRRGLAGSHACGAVLVESGTVPVIERTQVSRLIVWGGGLTGDLPEQPGGWSWLVENIASTDPDAPLAELQKRMRRAESVLAARLSAEGFLTVLDGPLTFVRSSDLPVLGYIKTHHQPLLEPGSHRRVPELMAGERTSVFAIGADRYSCYLRLADAGEAAGPWAGVVRLEVSQAVGLAAAVDTVNRTAAVLPAFAGVAHRDPRAPQNLQPVGALETRLRHLLGHPGLARRAVRSAVLQVTRSASALDPEMTAAST